MAFIIGKIQCYFCGNKEGLLHTVHDYGCYGDIGKRFFYHDQCLQMIEAEPEKFAHIMVDKALHINELKQQCIIKCNSKIESDFKKKVETLNKKHFERMMPKRY